MQLSRWFAGARLRGDMLSVQRGGKRGLITRCSPVRIHTRRDHLNERAICWQPRLSLTPQTRSLRRWGDGAERLQDD